MRQPELKLVPIAEMARRIGRSQGHLARLCRQQLAAAGLAKKAREPGGPKASWVICSAWQPKHEAKPRPAEVLASIGGETSIIIRITPPGHVTVEVFGSGSKAG